MSSSTLGQASTSSSNLKSILDAALSRALSHYKDKTASGNGLLDHPLAIEMHRCDSVDAIKAVFQGQAEAFQQFRDGDQRLMRWITRVVDVLYTVSETLDGVVRPRNPVRDHSKHIPILFFRRSPMQRPSLVGSVSFLLSVYSPKLFADSF
jgi:hypothetical protein